MLHVSQPSLILGIKFLATGTRDEKSSHIINAICTEILTICFRVNVHLVLKVFLD